MSLVQKEVNPQLATAFGVGDEEVNPQLATAFGVGDKEKEAASSVGESKGIRPDRRFTYE